MKKLNKILTLRFPMREFKKLQNAKEEAVILGKCRNWEEFILLKAKIN